MKTIKPIFCLILLSAALLMGCHKNDDGVKFLETPMNLTASDSFALKVELYWDPVENAAGYGIYRADDDGSTPTDDLDFTLVGSSETEDFDDLSVNSSSSYFYQVEAVRDGIRSERSTAVPGKTRKITADEAFSILAEYTGGKRYDAINASLVPEILIEVIKEQASVGTDLVFLIDNTSSMNDDIYEVKQALTEIISTLPPNNRLAMAVYNDANTDPDGWYHYFDLTSDYGKAQEFLDAISVYGGGDYPESVYDGLYLTLDNLSWSSTSKRMILILGDAPPLEGGLTVYSLKDVVDNCKKSDVVTNLYPVLIGN